MDLRLLGPVEMAIDGRPVAIGRRQERCVLAILALEAARPVPLDRIIELTWEIDPPATAREVVHTYVSRLRSSIRDAGGDAGMVRRQGSSYVIDIDPERVDAHRFQRMVGESRLIAAPAERAGLLRAALSLWRGLALSDIGSESTRLRLGATLEIHRHEAFLLRIEAELADGRHRELIGELSEVTQREPLDEQIAGYLMLALYRSGRRADALAAYQSLRDRLILDLGLEPGAEVAALQTAILRGDASLSLRPEADGDPEPAGAAPGPEPRSRPVPAQLPPDIAAFFGRRDDLKQLHGLLDVGAGARRSVMISAVSGPGGIGKTTLAVHFAHEVADRFPDGQLYINLRGYGPAGTVMPPAEALGTLLDGLGTAPSQIPVNVTARMGLYRSLFAGRRMLVLLDNARDAEHVRALIPGAPGCMAIITSRNDMSGLVATGDARPLVLATLSSDESHDLLGRRVGADRLAAEPEAVTEIIRRCAGLPLALAIVAARAATRPAATLAELAGELRLAATALDAFSSADASADIRTVFSWSYAALSPAAMVMFQLLGTQPGPDISVRAAASLAGIPADEAAGLLAELSAAHLVSEPAPGRYAFHDLLRAFAAETASERPAAELDRARLRLYDHYLHSAYAAGWVLYPERRPLTLAPCVPDAIVDDFAGRDEAIAWFRRERAALVAAVCDASEYGPEAQAVQLSQTIVTYLDRAGHWQDRISTNEAALRCAVRMGDRAESAHLHKSLGFAHAQLDAPDEAVDHFNQAMEIHREVGDRSGEALAHIGIIHVLDRAGRYAEGAPHAEAAIELYRVSRNQVGLARALNAAGWCYAQLGEFDTAIDRCEQAIAQFVSTDDRHGEAGTWDSLGYIQSRLGAYEKAAAHFQHAIDMYHDLRDVYREGETLMHLANLERDAGHHEQADTYGRRAVEVLEINQHPAVEEIRALLQGRD